MTNTLLWLIAGHLVGDFPFQSEWLAQGKGKSWELNLYHALIYAASIMIVAKIGGITVSLPALLLFFTSHFFIDPLKARWHIVKHIWVDQLLHLAVILCIIFFF